MKSTEENGHHTHCVEDSATLSEKESIQQTSDLRMICKDRLEKPIHLGLKSTDSETAPAEVVRGIVLSVRSNHGNRSILLIRNAELVGVKQFEKKSEQPVDLTLIRVVEYDDENVNLKNFLTE